MGKTRIFASTGRPILHSASPQMHNAGFRELGMDAVYIRLSAASAEEALLVARQIGMSGMSITSPLKEKMLALLDRKDARVQKLGAVNTVKLEGGKASGFNTDGDGVSGSLAAIGVAIKGKRAVVLGAGGAAKAAVCALAEAGANVTVAARKKEKASALARQFGCESCLLEGEGFASAMAGAEIVVSALNTHERVVPPELFRKGMTVLDATYSAETALSSDAAAAGCRVIGGEEWLLWQGVTAFGIFTGEKAPITAMREAISNSKKGTGRKRNIALIGFMGSGKSKVAREISKLTGMERIDTDEEVRGIAGKSINDIFEQDGERKFREIERQVISRLQSVQGRVISCGGGAVLDERNAGVLKENCTVVWLWASGEETARRLEGEKGRPLLEAKDRKARIEALLSERVPKYAACADVVVGTDGKAASDVAKLIVDETGIARKG